MGLFATIALAEPRLAGKAQLPLQRLGVLTAAPIMQQLDGPGELRNDVSTVRRRGPEPVVPLAHRMVIAP